MRVVPGLVMTTTLCVSPNFTAAENLGFETDFVSPDTAWHIADYHFSHPMFDTDWSKKNALLDKGLRLTLTPQTSSPNRFLGASVRRERVTHWGRYEARLKAARGSGVITGFFLYSGPAYGTQHDEIDWEFFGQDTYTAQVAWFKNGQIQEHKINLGFDAAEDHHDYAIEWYPNKIRWFVEKKLVFEAIEDIPQSPQRLFLNLWAADPSISNWAGLATPKKLVLGTEALVSHVQFIPFNLEADGT